MIFFIVFSFL